MADPAANGNGNGRGAREVVAYLFAAFSALTAIATLGKSAIDDVEADRTAGDAALATELRAARDAVGDLVAAREQDAYHRGVTDQRLTQLAELSATNAANLQAAFRELDTKLQREMQLADETIRAGLVDLDSRLQGEIAVSRAQRAEALAELQRRLDDLEERERRADAAAWTRDDQRRFEDLLGVRARANTEN